MASRGYTPVECDERENAKLERVRAVAIDSQYGDDKLAKMLGVTIYVVNAACLGVRMRKRRCPKCERATVMPCVACRAEAWKRERKSQS